MNIPYDIKNELISDNKHFSSLWRSRRKNKNCLIPKVIVPILLIALTSIFCSEEKDVYKTPTIHLWRYTGCQELQEYIYLERYKQNCRRTAMINTLFSPYLVFLNTPVKSKVDKVKINQWYDSVINNNASFIDNISITEDIIYLNDLYKDIFGTNDLNKKILRFIQDNIIIHTPENSLPNLFFKAIVMENVEKYYFVAKQNIFVDFDSALYLNRYTNSDEIIIKLIYENDVTNTLENISHKVFEGSNAQQNHSTNHIIILKIDLDFIGSNFNNFYKTLLYHYNSESNINKKFSEDHEIQIQNYFAHFIAKHDEISKRCIEKNETIFLFYQGIMTIYAFYLKKIKVNFLMGILPKIIINLLMKYINILKLLAKIVV